MAGLLAGRAHAFFTGRKPARAVSHRLRPAVAAQDRAAAAGGSPEDPNAASVLLHVESGEDGSVVFQFGAQREGTLGQPAAAQNAPPAAAACAPASLPASDVEPAALATAGTATQHAYHAANDTASGSGGSAATALLPAAVQRARLVPAPWQADVPEAEEPSGSGNGSSSSDSRGSTPHELPYVHNGWYSTPAAAAERDAGAPSGHGGPRRRRQPQQQGFYGGAASAAAAAQVAADKARSMDYGETQAGEVVAVYEALCDAGDLDEALTVIKGCIRASRADVLARLKHYRFLRPAARRKAVKPALRFVQLLPRQFADARTYNMLLRVCAQAGDLRNALHVADMLQAAGLRMDAILYTTLISACAAAGDAEKAFQLYAQMRADGLPADRMVYSSVVRACAEQIDRLPPSERRQQLVLLERAFQLVEDMKAARTAADAAVWNALVLAAGRAGQLQRAFNVLEDMLHCGTRPNDRTYAALIDACARAGDKELALRVYRKARREGCATTLMVYAAAVHACINAADGCDSQAVMAIYTDMQRSRVEADNQLFGMLMRAAGAGGDLDLVLGLREEMLREGLRPCTGTESALLAVHIRAGLLPEAQAIYRSLRARGEFPHPYAVNALLNAYANHFRLGDVVSLVCDMAEAEVRPDGFTFAAIFNACQRADEAELALDVARLMKLRGVRMDETHAVMLLRICYNRLRQGWVPGGYPPHRPLGAGGGGGASRLGPLRERLLEALKPRGSAVELREQLDVAWVAQAFGVYREAVAAGVKPSMRMLNRMLMCLRVAWEGKQTHPAGDALQALAASPDQALLPHSLPPGLGPVPGVAGVRRQEKIGVESVYHVQAVSIVEEAIISNVVPSFKIDSSEPIDLRGMPPAVAEVYVLTVLSALQRLCEARRVVTQNLAFLVPRYDGAKVFMPSHLSHVDFERVAAAAGEAAQQPQATVYDSDDEAYGFSFADADEAFARASSAPLPGAAAGESAGDERTGLGVAGVLRRLRLWAREYSDKGFILLEAKEITRWCKATARAVERRSASALAVQKPYGQPMGRPGLHGLQQQQRQIRMDF